jgi:hypothetical protein
MEYILDLLLDGDVHKCTAYLQWVHIKAWLWFGTHVGSVVALPPPDFTRILDGIKLQC